MPSRNFDVTTAVASGLGLNRVGFSVTVQVRPVAGQRSLSRTGFWFGCSGLSMFTAALARVSKQTVYTHFADKERLFTDLVLRNAVLIDEFLDTIAAMLRNTTDLEKDLGALARAVRPLRDQAPDAAAPQARHRRSRTLSRLARAYYERVPERVLATLASEFAHLTERGLLHTDDPRLAADHFAWLIVGMRMDRAMFLGADDAPGPGQLDRLADAGIRAFLSAYRPR